MLAKDTPIPACRQETRPVGALPFEFTSRYRGTVGRAQLATVTRNHFRLLRPSRRKCAWNSVLMFIRAIALSPLGSLGHPPPEETSRLVRVPRCLLLCRSEPGSSGWPVPTYRGCERHRAFAPLKLCFGVSVYPAAFWRSPCSWLRQCTHATGVLLSQKHHRFTIDCGLC